MTRNKLLPSSNELLPMTMVCRIYLQTLAKSFSDIDVSMFAKTLADLWESDSDITHKDIPRESTSMGYYSKKIEGELTRCR